MIQPQPRAHTHTCFVVFFSLGLLLAGCSGGGLLESSKTRARIGLSAAATQVDAKGGTVSVEITNSGEEQLRWSVSTNEDWARIEGRTSGTGTATLTLRFEANPEYEERSVTLTVSDPQASNSPQTIQFTQEASPRPVLGVSVDSYNVDAEGETVSVSVKNDGPGELSWTASLSGVPSWVRFVGKDAGTGDAEIRVQVDANETEDRRSFTLEVSASDAEQSPQVLNFSQDAQPPIKLEVSADITTIPSDGGDAVITVLLSSASATWTAAVDGDPAPGWVQASRSGSTLTVRAQANPDDEARSFSVTVISEDAQNSPQTLQFTQEAAELPVITVTADDYTVSADGQSVEIMVSFSR